MDSFFPDMPKWIGPVNSFGLIQVKSSNCFFLWSEVTEIASAFDTEFKFKHDLRSVLRFLIALNTTKDCKLLFDVMMKTTAIAEKRLVTDQGTVKDEYTVLKVIWDWLEQRLTSQVYCKK